jgi:hypothetical protein
MANFAMFMLGAVEVEAVRMGRKALSVSRGYDGIKAAPGRTPGG